MSNYSCLTGGLHVKRIVFSVSFKILRRKNIPIISLCFSKAIKFRYIPSL